MLLYFQLLILTQIFVANAGIIVPKTLLETSVEEWDRVQAVYLTLTSSASIMNLIRY